MCRKCVNCFDSGSNLFKPLEGRKIVVASNFNSGEFRGGTLNKLEFYSSKNNGFDFNGRIWFKGGGFATGLDDVYDVMIVDSYEEEQITPHDLKIFNFSAHAGEESEYSSVKRFCFSLAY